MEKKSAILEVRAGKYLTFQLGEESYGFEILRVQEIIGLIKVTKLPNVPAFIRGVINLRGKVIPVIDLRLKFGMATREDTDRTCIIVVQYMHAEMPITMGVIVDEVSEVVDVKEEQIEPPPSFGSAIDTRYILGMGLIGQKVLSLLDINMVLSLAEFALMARVDGD